MPISIRTVLGFIAGTILAFVLVIAVEAWSSVVHPLPKDFVHTFENMCAHVANYPTWILALAGLMWGGIAFLAVFVAMKSGTWVSGWLVGVLLLALGLMNIGMLPYPIWFKILTPILIAASLLLVWSKSRKTKLVQRSSSNK